MPGKAGAPLMNCLQGTGGHLRKMDLLTQQQEQKQQQKTKKKTAQSELEEAEDWDIVVVFVEYQYLGKH